MEVSLVLPDGWLTDEESSALQAMAHGRVVLELGAWKGRSTVALAQTAELVVSVDRHRPFTHFGEEVPDDTLPEYLAAVRSLKNVVVIVGEFSAAALFDVDAFGLVFVDGLHDYTNVVADLRLAMRFRSTIVSHDWGRFEVCVAAESLGMAPSRVVGSLAVFG